jgi:hypothetical protein
MLQERWRFGHYARCSIAWAKKHRRSLGYLFSGLLLAFLGYYIYRNWQLLGQYEFTLDPFYLALSIILLVPTFWFPALLWWRITADALHAELNWRVSVRLWFTSQITRYLPGGVWNLFSRVYLFGEQGVSKSQTALGLVLETVFVLMAQVLVFVLSLPFWLDQAVSFYWALLVLPLGLLLIHPAVLKRSMHWIARLQGRPDLPQTELRGSWTAMMLAGYTAGAILGGSAFFFFVRSLYPVPLQLWPVLAGMVNLAQTIGFLTLFAPNGLVVREGILILLLGWQLPVPVAVISALSSRLWLLAGELIGLAASRAL